MDEITWVYKGLAGVGICALPYLLDWLDEVMGWGMAREILGNDGLPIQDIEGLLIPGETIVRDLR